MDALDEIMKLIADFAETADGIKKTRTGAKLLTKAPCKCGDPTCGVARMQAKAAEFLAVVAELEAEEAAKIERIDNNEREAT